MLLKRKSADALEAALEAQAERTVWRSTIRQQQHSSSLQIETDEEITILPYAYFQEARCRKKGETWEIALYWPWVVVRIKGMNMQKMPDLIGDHELASLEFHPEGQRVRRDDQPEVESVTLIPRTEAPLLPPPAEAQSAGGAIASHRYSYPVG
jgi:hypothetical protein